MFLTKGGITVEAFHPADIARYKALRFVEVEASALAPDSKNADAIEAVATPIETPTAKAKGTVKRGT